MEDSDKALELDVLSATLRIQAKSTFNLIDYLAQLLSEALPQRTTLKKSGFFVLEKRHVKELTIKFDDYHYQLLCSSEGSITAKELKVVRGVILKSTEITTDECIGKIVSQLLELAKKNAEARQALETLING